MAGIGSIFSEPDPPLPEAARLRAVERDGNVLLADIGMVRRHRHRGGIADRPPLAQRHRRPPLDARRQFRIMRSEEHTSELQSLMRISYAVFCLKKKNT